MSDNCRMGDHFQSSKTAFAPLAKALHKACIIPPVILLGLLCLWSVSTVLPFSMIVQFCFPGRRVGLLCFPTGQAFSLNLPFMSGAHDKQSLTIEQPEAETMPAFLISKDFKRDPQEEKLIREKDNKMSKMKDQTSLEMKEDLKDGIQLFTGLKKKRAQVVGKKVQNYVGCTGVKNRSTNREQDSSGEVFNIHGMASEALAEISEGGECRQCHNVERSLCDQANEVVASEKEEHSVSTESAKDGADRSSNLIDINDSNAPSEQGAATLDSDDGKVTRSYEGESAKGAAKPPSGPSGGHNEEVSSGRSAYASNKGGNSMENLVKILRPKIDNDPPSPQQKPLNLFGDGVEPIINGIKKQDFTSAKKDEDTSVNGYTKKEDFISVDKGDDKAFNGSRKDDSTSVDKDEGGAILNNFSEFNLATKEAMKIVEAIRATAMAPREDLVNFHLQKDDAGKDYCDKKWVYMYNLPSKFNKDLLENCKQLIPWFNMCPSIQNSGMGNLIKTKGEENDATLVPAGRWYETHQYALEILFHSRFQKYPCLTSSAGKADFFYIPYYAGLDVLRWHFLENVTNSRKDKLGLELIKWLEGQEWWRRNEGEDHVLVLGKIAYDFRRVNDKAKSWGSNLLNQPQMKKVTKLLIERLPWDKNDVGIPHPTFFHPRSDSDVRVWQSHIHHAERKHLVSFAGLPRPDQPHNIRSLLISHCVKRPVSCHYLPCLNNICMQPKKAMSLFLHSHFCLQPPGDSPTRRSIFDSLIAGCIPVFFDPYSAYLQYPWHLPANSTHYSVYISPSHVKDSKVNVVDVLATIPPYVRDEMRKRIIYEIMPGLVYAETGSKLTEMDDAFDISIKNLIWRMARKNCQRSLNSFRCAFL